MAEKGRSTFPWDGLFYNGVAGPDNMMGAPGGMDGQMGGNSSGAPGDMGGSRSYETGCRVVMSMLIVYCNRFFTPSS